MDNKRVHPLVVPITGGASIKRADLAAVLLTYCLFLQKNDE